LHFTDAQMEDILIRSLQGRTVVDEEALLDAWRRASPDHERRYQEVSSLWRMTADRLAVGPATPPSARMVILRARRAARLKRRRRVSGAAAAAAIVLVTGGILGSLLLSRGGAAGGGNGGQYAEVTTGDGERTTIELRDGTAVRLGPNSTLRVLDGDDPVVWLDGRAFFGVRPDSLRNFTVETPNGQARALGTRFEVFTEASELRVLVVEGNVRVTAGDTAVEVGEGLVTRSSAGGPPETTLAENVEEMLAWMGAALLFHDTRLDRVVSEIEFRYGVRVQLESPGLADIPVTATFTDQPLEGVLFVVCEITGAECFAENGGFRMR